MLSKKTLKRLLNKHNQIVLNIFEHKRFLKSYIIDKEASTVLDKKRIQFSPIVSRRATAKWGVLNFKNISDPKFERFKTVFNLKVFSFNLGGVYDLCL